MKIAVVLVLSIVMNFQIVQTQSDLQFLEQDWFQQLNDLLDTLPEDSDLQNKAKQLLDDLDTILEQAEQERKNLDHEYLTNVTALTQLYQPQLQQLQSEVNSFDSQMQQLENDIESLKEQKKNSKDNNKKKQIQQQIDSKNDQKKQLKDQNKQTNKKLNNLQEEYEENLKQLDKEYEKRKIIINQNEEKSLKQLDSRYEQLKVEVDDFFAQQKNDADKETTYEDTPDETPDETTDQTPDETTDQTPDETTDQTPDETTDQTPDETTDQTPDENQNNEEQTCNAKPIYYREPVTKIIGSTFNKKGYSQWTYDNFQFVEAITIYFTASWCGACQSFTPQLEQFYIQVNSGGCFKYENVASLYEYQQSTYDSYSQEMSFARQPYGQNSVYSSYGVSGLPTLILINKDGTEANRNGRSDVTYKGISCFTEWVQQVAAYSNPQYEQSTTQQQTDGKPSNVDDVSWTAFLESNKFRNSQGKDNQVWDNLLYELCVGHNSYQIKAGTISHDGFSNRCTSIPNWSSCAENVAYNYDATNPGAKAVDQWINSDGHRKNILSDNQYMAVSGVKEDSTGRWYFCQFFANKSQQLF